MSFRPSLAALLDYRPSPAVLAGLVLLPCALAALMLLGAVLPTLLPLAMGIGFAVGCVGLLALAALIPISIIWVYRDANSRGISGLALVLLLFLCPNGWPWILLAWIVFRPEKQRRYRYMGRGAFFRTAGHA